MVIAYKVKRNPSKTFHFHFYLLSGTIARNFIVHFSSYRFSCTALRVPIHRQFSFLPFGLRPKSGDTQLNFGRIIPGKKIRENRIRRREEGYPVALSFYFATSSIFLSCVHQKNYVTKENWNLTSISQFSRVKLKLIPRYRYLSIYEPDIHMNLLRLSHLRNIFFSLLL